MRTKLIEEKDLLVKFEKEFTLHDIRLTLQEIKAEITDAIEDRVWISLAIWNVLWFSQLEKFVEEGSFLIRDQFDSLWGLIFNDILHDIIKLFK